MIEQDLTLISKYTNKKYIFPKSEFYFDSWEKIKHFLLELMKSNDKWIFRGVNDASFTIQSTLERALEKDTFRIAFFENIIGEFFISAHNYLKNKEIPKRNHYIDWLSIMQHHGAPTNLIDWTFSPYIASFFSVDGLEHQVISENRQCCIWAINKTMLSSLCKKYFEKKELIDLNIKNNELLSHPNYFEKIFNHTFTDNHGFVLPVNPFKKNIRLLSQQGTFTYLGNLRFDFAYNLGNLINNFIDNKNILHANIIIKITFPSRIYEKIMYDLFLMNITSRTLFHGLDGFSRSIKQYASKLSHQILRNAIFKE